jgi:hypothetical protein
VAQVAGGPSGAAIVKCLEAAGVHSRLTDFSGGGSTFDLQGPGVLVGQETVEEKLEAVTLHGDPNEAQALTDFVTSGDALASPGLAARIGTHAVLRDLDAGGPAPPSELRYLDVVEGCIQRE